MIAIRKMQVDEKVKVVHLWVRGADFGFVMRLPQGFRKVDGVQYYLHGDVLYTEHEAKMFIEDSNGEVWFTTV
jgi:hypothetical protein